MPAIELIAPDIYRVDNGRGTELTLIKKTGKNWTHWGVQSVNARTQVMHGNRGLPGVRTYNTLAEVERHHKAFRDFSQLINQSLT